jgi:hypothetical protein
VGKKYFRCRSCARVGISSSASAVPASRARKVVSLCRCPQHEPRRFARRPSASDAADCAEDGRWPEATCVVHTSDRWSTDWSHRRCRIAEPFGQAANAFQGRLGAALPPNIYQPSAQERRSFSVRSSSQEELLPQEIIRELPRSRFFTGARGGRRHSSTLAEARCER